MRVDLEIQNINNLAIRRLDDQVRGLPGLLRTRVYGKGQLKISRRVAVIAKRNHPYRDRTGGLTRSLRGRFQRARYGGVLIRAGAAQIVAGGIGRRNLGTITQGPRRRRRPGAQAGLVEYGHNPPQVRARPYPFIVPAVRNNRPALARIGLTEMQKEYGRLKVGIETGSLSRELQRLARR